MTRRKWIIAIVMAIAAQVQSASAQSTANTAAYLPTLLKPARVPHVREYLIALGDRIQVAGKERLTSVGKHTDKQGGLSAQLTCEAGRIRYDRVGTSTARLAFDNTGGQTNATPGVSMNGLAATPSVSDYDVLESLLSDGAESFLYGFAQGHAHRLLGDRLRTDNGKTANYKGALV